MKSCRTNHLAHLMTLWLVLSSAGDGFSQSRESLERLIAQSITPATGFERSLMDKLLPAWEGTSTAAGLNLILDKHMTDNNSGDVNMACAYMLRKIGLPKDQVATVLMERAEIESAKEDELWRLAHVLAQMEKMIDRTKQGKEVVPFIARYLSDKRFIEPSYRGREAVPRQRLRVSDAAMGALIQYLENTGLCQKYDPRFGDPGGSAMWSRRDEVADAVVMVLQEKGFLPADFWATLAPIKHPKVSPITVKGAASSNQPLLDEANQVLPKARKLTASSPSEEPTLSTPWSIIVLLFVAATGLLWLLVKKRK
jgi:hypothetical protein